MDKTVNLLNTPSRNPVCSDLYEIRIQIRWSACELRGLRRDDFHAAHTVEQVKYAPNVFPAIYWLKNERKDLLSYDGQAHATVQNNSCNHD